MMHTSLPDCRTAAGGSATRQKVTQDKPRNAAPVACVHLGLDQLLALAGGLLEPCDEVLQGRWREWHGVRVVPAAAVGEALEEQVPVGALRYSSRARHCTQRLPTSRSLRRHSPWSRATS